MNPGVGFFLLFLFFIVIFGVLATKLEENTNKDKPTQAVPEKRCPPHRWSWQDQPGIEPKTYFIKCEWCGRLPGYDRNEK